MNRTIGFTLLFSLLLHLALFWEVIVRALFSPTIDKPEQRVQEQTIEIQLQQTPQKPIPQPKPEPQKEADKPPPPKHLEDDITKANTSDGEADTDGGQKHKQKAHRQGQENNDDTNGQHALSPQSMQQNKLKALQKIFGKEIKDMATQDNKATHLAELNEEALDDDSLDDSNIEDPRDKQQEAKARWYNDVLKRISEQVHYVWVKPDGVSRNTWGIIKLDIDPQGYLLSAWVHLPSGNQALDHSALNAIRSVIRYQIPNSPKLSRYYRHLSFNFHGGEG